MVSNRIPGTPQRLWEFCMRQRKWLLLVLPLLGTFIAGIIGYSYLANVGQADTTNVTGKLKGADTLPIKQVVLFNSGVGYFQREGEVDRSEEHTSELQSLRHLVCR